MKIIDTTTKMHLSMRKERLENLKVEWIEAILTSMRMTHIKETPMIKANMVINIKRISQITTLNQMIVQHGPNKHQNHRRENMVTCQEIEAMIELELIRTVDQCL